jgi:hypothetical protein
LKLSLNPNAGGAPKKGPGGGGGGGGGAGGFGGGVAFGGPPVSGNHPDDNQSVASTAFTTPWLINSESEIGVFLSGYGDGVGHILGNYNIATALVDENLNVLGGGSLSQLKTLIIGSGGLMGHQSGTFKAKLKDFVNNGGTLVVFDQALGEDFNVIPSPQGLPPLAPPSQGGGTIQAYGWDEDQSCFGDGVYLAANHPVLSGQNRGTLNVSVDGYFSKLPDGATVILRRTMNQNPALIEYAFGNGRVIAGTIFPDWGAGHGQWSDDAARLTRDIALYAAGRGTIAPLSPAGSGAVTVAAAYSTPSGDVVAADLPRAASADMSVYSSTGGLMSVQNVLVNMGVGQQAALSVNVTAGSDLGIGRVTYVLKDADGMVIQDEKIGGTYDVSVPVQINGVTPGSYELWVTVPEENVIRGSTVTYTIHLRNNTDADLNNAPIGVGGHEQGGAYWRLYDVLAATIPAKSETTLTYQRKLDLSTIVEFGLNPVNYSSGFFQGTTPVGEKAVWVMDPNVKAALSPEKLKYLPGNKALIDLSAANAGAAGITAAVQAGSQKSSAGARGSNNNKRNSYFSEA